MGGRFVRTTGADVWSTEGSGASDDELVRAAARGDAEAFTVLYRRYRTDVWQLAWLTLRDHHDAEDVVQETWLKAHRHLDRHRAGASLRAWLLTICRNASRDRLRAARRRDTVALDDELAAVVAAAVPEDDRERSIDFHRAFERLGEPEREAFLLVDVMGCTSDEAARIVGVRAASTLRSRLARARAELEPAVSEPAVSPERAS